MIKKFKEYYEELTISKEDFEDQFLRLIEVYKCGMLWSSLSKYPDHKKKSKLDNFADFAFNRIQPIQCAVVFLPKEYETNKNIIKPIREELENIKIRIEEMYPIRMKIDKFDPRTKQNKMDSNKDLINLTTHFMDEDFMKTQDGGDSVEIDGNYITTKCVLDYFKIILY